MKYGISFVFYTHRHLVSLPPTFTFFFYCFFPFSSTYIPFLSSRLKWLITMGRKLRPLQITEPWRYQFLVPFVELWHVVLLENLFLRSHWFCKETLISFSASHFSRKRNGLLHHNNTSVTVKHSTLYQQYHKRFSLCPLDWKHNWEWQTQNA